MNLKTKKIVLFALLAAILIIMSFTPLGYLRIGVVEITFIMIPVVVCAAATGPLFGGIMGLLFGTMSFLSCFGMSPFGSMLLSINPYFTFIVCIAPRVLFGTCAGFVYKWLSRTKLPSAISDVITMLSSAILHTVTFVGLLMLCFGRTEFINSFGSGFFAIVWTLVGINGVVEWIVCATVGAAILRAVQYFIARQPKKSKKDKSGQNSER
ncbi:MAG: ECF transporter S component [Christensenellales bacterium]